MAPGGYTGGEPVASAGAVAVDPGGGGDGAGVRGGGGRRGVREGVVVAPEARVGGGGGGKGGGGGVPSTAVTRTHEAVAAGLLETVAFQQQQLRQLQQRQRQQQLQLQQENRKRLDLRQGSPKSAQQAASTATNGAGMVVVDVGATSCLEGATDGRDEAAPQATPGRTDCSKAGTGEQVGVSQEDTMDRLAQSLAQVSDVRDVALFFPDNDVGRGRVGCLVTP